MNLGEKMDDFRRGVNDLPSRSKGISPRGVPYALHRLKPIALR